MRTVTVIARQVSTRLDSEEDADIAEEYAVGIDDDVPESDVAGVALDVFHDNIAVDCLDDFEFTVKDSKGVEILEPEDYEGYSGIGRGKMV